MQLSQAKTIIKHVTTRNLEVLKNGGSHNDLVVPYLESDPGCGKTSVVDQLADEMNGRVEVLRLVDRLPNDVAGWSIPNAERTVMKRVQPDWMPDEKESLVYLFLDELPQAAVMNQNTAGQIINERKVGPYNLPRNTIVIAAGNPPKARAGTNQMPTHVRDRLTFLHVSPDAEDVTRYFQTIDVDPRVVGYLRHRPDMLSRFDKDAQSCPSPRSWQRVSSTLSAGMPRSLTMLTVSGTVGQEAATDFTAYLKLAEQMPHIDEILTNPDKAPIPTEPGILYAIAAALVPRLNKDHAEAITTYLRRIDRKEIAGYVYSDAISRDKKLVELPAVHDWFMKEGREILMTE